MILTDSGPLVALIDAGQPEHERCRAALGSLHGPMLVTWPVFDEAMNQLGEAGGWKGQDALWLIKMRGDLEVAEMPSSLSDHVHRLMEKHHERGMTIADATLIALAELKKLKRIFSLDPAFDTYRLRGRERFERIPR